ncbi:hypothetical protein CRE_29140 [Caenorhabditis remanei]|uniref:Uncharacterized protein n=1 Tax=Caenorhabditis remanei TaxID=31234 RepID=E3N4K6_CAERE|nr:hypothetical protein CRE_29140 [Caenorhabditis remanei]
MELVSLEQYESETNFANFMKKEDDELTKYLLIQHIWSKLRQPRRAIRNTSKISMSKDEVVDKKMIPETEKMMKL